MNAPMTTTTEEEQAVWNLFDKQLPALGELAKDAARFVREQWSVGAGVDGDLVEILAEQLGDVIVAAVLRKQQVSCPTLLRLPEDGP